MRRSILNSLVLSFILSFSIIAKSQSYSRIISLAPSLTKDIHLLKVEERLVGITNYCELETDLKVPIVASAVDLNIERIITQQPDLVLATSLTSTENLEMMRKVGLEVKFFPLPKSFKDINDQFMELGALLNKSELANQIVQDAHQRVEIIRKGSSFKDAKVFMAIGTNPLFCVIPNTFLNDYISFLGGQNIASDLRNGAISRESVILRNPDYIFIVTMGTIGDEEIKTWESYPNLSAAKSKRVFVIDSEKACSPSPINFVETLEEIMHQISNKK